MFRGLSGIFCVCLLLAPCVARSATVRLPVTGQTTCYSPTGEVITCVGSGQDGETHKGEVWPTPRFTDNRDGTITDNYTNLIWLRNAGCIGAVSWSAALAGVQALSSGQCGLTDRSAAGTWRLPNVSELESLIDLSAVSPALPPGQLFTNLEPSAFWSSTTHAHYVANAWTVNLNDGSVGGDVKTLQYLVLPVTGGL